ncbi:hypothetical protein Barb7_02036 [Bacteroidales bacterium Barb7]|nr:hypothetical protein Barb7_02036 [Bacteroidales bacterium Barb7]
MKRAVGQFPVIFQGSREAVIFSQKFEGGGGSDGLQDGSRGYFPSGIVFVENIAGLYILYHQRKSGSLHIIRL